MSDLILKQSSNLIEFLLLNSIYALLLAVLVLAIKFVFSIFSDTGLSKRVEYGLWCVVLLRLILPSELSFDYAISGAVKEWLLNPSQNHFLSEFIAKASGSASAVQPAKPYQLTSSDIVYCFWLVIVGLVLMRYMLLRFKLLGMINRSQPIVEYPLVALANRWRLNFWIKRPVHVIAEDKYLSPFTFFFKSPIIFIPRKILATENEELIESIIAHEMAHVKRQDSLWLLIQNVIQIIYFFNPLVWLVVRRLSGLRENICDDMVLSAKQIEPEVYGNSL
ncbi:MAG: M56 family metallopeptidase, partial [Kangiellaceae bacterium]|nr:M56 family metallopeptidase [Kangiellaceae bacterium]